MKVSVNPNFVSRVFVHNFDGVFAYDAITTVPGQQDCTVNFDFPQGGNQDTLMSVTSLIGANIQCVQSSGAASAENVDVSSFTIPFTTVNTEGNSILIDVFALRDLFDDFVVTDSLGNTYNQTFLTAPPSAPADLWGQYIALGIAGGANTITITMSANPGVGTAIDWAIAIHEYSGVLQSGGPLQQVPITSSSLVQPTPITMTIPITVPVNQFIHMAVFSHSFNVGTTVTVPSATPGTPGGLPLIPPTYVAINDKTIPIYSLNFPMSNCEEQNPCRQRYPLL